jgi:hypothetical protein
MGNSNRSNGNRTKSVSYAALMLYLPPVMFGVVAACAGGIAWQRPVTGLCMLLFAMVGYIAVATSLARVIETMRADRVRPVVSLVRGGRQGRSGVGRDEFSQEMRSAARRAMSR